MSLTGQCLCGNIQYRLEGDPIATAVCHCTNCQRQSGAAFSVNIMAMSSQLTLDGELATYEDGSDSGNSVFRRFCSKCGSPIISELSASPGVVALKAGTLDDYSAINPRVRMRGCGNMSTSGMNMIS